MREDNHIYTSETILQLDTKILQKRFAVKNTDFCEARSYLAYSFLKTIIQLSIHKIFLKNALQISTHISQTCSTFKHIFVIIKIKKTVNHN